MRIWGEAAKKAIRRHVTATGSPLFTRAALIGAELAAIVAETQTAGITPTQTLTRELQQLRNAGLIEFVARGRYRWLGDMPADAPTTPSKGIFVLAAHSHPGDRPERNYHFPSIWRRTAIRMIGQWIIYEAAEASGEGGYSAAACVAAIDPDPEHADRLVARIAPGSYLEFGRVVPFVQQGELVERGLFDAEGSADSRRIGNQIRAITDADFNRIVDLGLVTEQEVLPRTDEDVQISQALLEERGIWEAPFDGATVLVNRKARNAQFRKRVLDVYGAQCALTGINIRNGGGRPETEAAHIKSVEAGGPDKVNNGIALSGTIHWMFDRGLISLSDDGDILLSRAINDRNSVERLIYPDCKARLPKAAAHRPDPRYLHWHRTNCFHE